MLSQYSPAWQQTTLLLSSTQARSPEQQTPATQRSPSQHSSSVAQVGFAGRQAPQRQTWPSPQQVPPQHDAAAQQTPPQTIVPTQPSQQQLPSPRQTSSA